MALDIQPPLPPIFDDQGVVNLLPPGYPAKEKPGRIYITIQGDFWDMIAIRCYGRQRGNEALMFRLLEENYPLREVCEFPAGIAVKVPEIDIAREIPLVPWKKATRNPSS